MRISDGVKRFWSHFWLLTHKNFMISVRNWKSSLLQLAAPVAFILFLFVAQRIPIATDSASPAPRQVGPVPRCVPFSSDHTCVTLLFAYDPPLPNETVSTRLISQGSAESILARLTSESEGAGLSESDVLRFNSSEEISAWILANPNSTLGALVFYARNNASSYSGNTVPIELWFNATPSADVPVNDAFDTLSYHVDRAIARELVSNSTGNSSAFFFESTNRAFPVVVRTNSFDAVTHIGPMLFFSSVYFQQLFFLYSLVSEKELGLREALKRVGMLESAYWASFFIYNVAFMTLLTLVTIAAGAAFQFRYFLKANFFAVFLNFEIFGIAMTPFSVMLSMLLQTTRSAINAGMGVFMLGVLMQIIFSVSFVLQILYSPTISRALVTVLQFWPPFNFARVSIDISSKTPQNVFGTPTAFQWGDLYTKKLVISNPSFEMPATVESWGWSAMDFGIFSAIAIILYSLLRTEGGWIRGKILVALARGNRHGKAVAISEETRKGNEVELDSTTGRDPDVAEEAKLANSADCKDPIRICDVRKVFRKHFFKKSPADVFAVRGVSLTVKEGEVFALLGANGAGKTTLLSVLNGMLTPSSGDVTIYGNSVLGGIDNIRRMLGVCPQHDTVWPELTAREHLRIFGTLKEVPKASLDAEVNSRLDDVLLRDVGDNVARSYSGGMKRRLSVAIAFVGTPKCCFLDEPSTGLDPVSRRQLWASIQRLKSDRCIILTTHSMEEADALGDRVAIMAEGTLRCIGTPLHIKNAYGSGYILTLSTTEDKVEAVRQYVSSFLPAAPLIVQTSGQLKFSIPSESLPSLAEFLQRLERDIVRSESNLHLTEAEQQQHPRGGCPVQDWGVSQTTLEEVFIRVGAQPKDQ